MFTRRLLQSWSEQLCHNSPKLGIIKTSVGNIMDEQTTHTPDYCLQKKGSESWCIHTEESQTCFTVQKKPDREEHTPPDSIYMRLSNRKKKSILIETRSMFAWSGEGRSTRVSKTEFLGVTEIFYTSVGVVVTGESTFVKTHPTVQWKMGTFVLLYANCISQLKIRIVTLCVKRI